MEINLSFDHSVASAPVGFETAIQEAASYLDQLIANNITVTIDVGWGEDGGSPLSHDDLGTGGPVISDFQSYSQLKSDLLANTTSPADQAALDSLPATDPTDGGTFDIASAEAKALGLSDTNSGDDGSVGFSSGVSWAYDPSELTANSYDLVGVAEHELTHALGRFDGPGLPPGQYTPMDLFRYSSAGVLGTAGQPSYFSMDGGNTNLGNFDTQSDYGDWAAGTPPDSFDADLPPGTDAPVSQNDISLMNALGFQTTNPNYLANAENAGAFMANPVTSGQVAGDAFFLWSAADAQQTGADLTSPAEQTQINTATLYLDSLMTFLGAAPGGDDAVAATAQLFEGLTDPAGTPAQVGAAIDGLASSTGAAFGPSADGVEFEVLFGAIGYAQSGTANLQAYNTLGTNLGTALGGLSGAALATASNNVGTVIYNSDHV